MQLGYNNTQVKAKLAKNESGQTLVEFLLLLVSIVLIAFTFMRTMNSELADVWSKMANIILEDESITLKPK
jgi:Flp pilus assembly pilin Flp